MIGMDRRTKESLRQIEYNENLRERLNLTPAQAVWKDADDLLAGALSPHKQQDIPFCCIALMQMDDPYWGVIKRLVPGRLIVRAERMHAAFLHRIDSRYWKEHNQRIPWRLNFQVTPIRIDADLLEPFAHPATDPNARDVFPSKDCAKLPRQDHWRYQLHSFNPHGTFGALQDAVIRSPRSGRFALTVNKLHMEVCIDDVPVYRFRAAEAGDIVTHVDDQTLAKDGETVQAGQPLIKLVSRCEYGAIKWDDRAKGKPSLDRIRAADMFSATRHGEMLGIASEMMLRIGLALHDDATGLEERGVQIRPLEKWGPRHLMEFQAETLAALPLRDDWVETPQLRQAILAGLQPDGEFYVRADVPEPVAFQSLEQHPHFIKLVFDRGHQMVLPKTAKLLPHVQGQSIIRPDDPIADWTERRFFHDWADVRSALPQVAHVAREYLRQSSVLPGTDGFTGQGVLIDSAYLPQTADFHSPIVGHYLDLRAGEEYLHNGVLIGPPLQHDDWTDWHRTANGVTLSCEPPETCLMANPVIDPGFPVQAASRRKRRG